MTPEHTKHSLRVLYEKKKGCALVTTHESLAKTLHLSEPRDSSINIWPSNTYLDDLLRDDT